MKRKDFLKYAGLLSAGFTVLPKLSFKQNSPFSQLRGGVGIFSMRGGTIGWYTTDDGILAIDSQYPDPATAFVEGISEFGTGMERVLMNTHHHGDHVGGNLIFKNYGYQIIAHQNVPELQRNAAIASDNEANQAYPDTVFSDQYRKSMGSETITAKYYGAAHTKGDSVIWFENANIAHMGDLLFNRLYPFIDRNGGASIRGWMDLLETVYAEADDETLFIYGHGNPEFGVTGNREDLMVKRDFLTKLLEYTENAIQEGRSREEIISLDQFEEFPDYFSPSAFLSLPRNLDVAYLELTSEL